MTGPYAAVAEMLTTGTAADIRKCCKDAVADHATATRETTWHSHDQSKDSDES